MPKQTLLDTKVVEYSGWLGSTTGIGYGYATNIWSIGADVVDIFCVINPLSGNGNYIFAQESSDNSTWTNIEGTQVDVPAKGIAAIELVNPDKEYLRAGVYQDGQQVDAIITIANARKNPTTSPDVVASETHVNPSTGHI